ncbi:MAG: glycosyl hydrolase [Anaerolineae bacterium]|nr:glycosyl hydrolase [Anaerolineae bacterium]MDQ7035620.1 glycosyl hydrolase [Anaerolineae bacterium]
MAVPIDFGMNVAVLPGTRHGEPTNIADLGGAKWARMVFFHSRHFNMDETKSFAYYDAIVKKYAEQGIGSLFVLIQDTFWGNGPWDSGGWDVYAENFGVVVGKIAKHFKGKSVAYQVWNEPDLSGSSIPMNPQNYALILNTVSKAIKAEDVNAPVVMAGLAKGAGEAVQYVQDVRKAIPSKRLPVDGIAIHFYGQYVGNKKPTDAEHPGGVFGSLEESLKIFKRGIPNIPVWITEIGIVNHDDNFRWNDAQNKAIARYIENVINYMQRNHSSWVKAVIWFAWGDIMENGGMVDLEGKQKPQYHAFVNTIRSQKVEQSPYILTPTTTLNVRQADYSQFEKVGRAEDGTIMTVLDPPALAKAKMADDSTEQWICVKNPVGDGQAWVAAWLMEVAAESPLTIRRKGGGFMNLRSGNMRELTLAGEVKKGDKISPLESPSIAFEKVRLGDGDKTFDNLKNWIYVETPFGQRAWVAAWYMKVHEESETPAAIEGADSTKSSSTLDDGKTTGETPPPALLSADELAAILSEEVKKFAGDGDVAGQALLPLSDDMHKTYAINVVGDSGVSVRVLARIISDKIVIEADVSESLLTNLGERGVSRGQIVLVYAGETRPS